jgi:hypothetical protein
MKIFTAAFTAVVLALAACGGDSGPELTNEQWCETAVWEAGLAPEGWGHAELMEDCVGALEGGLFDRDATLDVYEGM